MPRPDAELEDASRNTIPSDEAQQQSSAVDLLRSVETMSAFKGQLYFDLSKSIDSVGNTVKLRADRSVNDLFLPSFQLDDEKTRVTVKKEPANNDVAKEKNNTQEKSNPKALTASKFLPSFELEKLKDLAGTLAHEVTDLYETVATKIEKHSQESPASFATFDGGTWKKDGADWSQYDKNGHKVKAPDGKVADLVRDEENNLLVKLADGRALKQQADGSVLEYDKSNHLKSITLQNGSVRKFEWEGKQLVAMSSSKGNYTRVRDKDGKLTDEWRQKGEAVGWKGELKADEKNGDLTVGNTIYRSNMTVETINNDGSRNILHPNKDLVRVGKDGLVSEINFADGVNRKLTWKENPNAKENDDKFILNGVRVEREGKTYQHSRVDGDKWQVSTLENNRWSAATPETTSFDFDKKSNAYSFVDSADGIKHVIRPGGERQDVTADGATLDYKNDKLVKASKGDTVREFEWKKGDLQSIRDGVQNKVWTPDGDKWKSDKGDLREGKPVISPTGEIEFKKGDTSSIIKMDGTESKRVTNEKDKSQVETNGRHVQVTSADGSIRKYKSDESGKELVQESRTRNGRTESWTRAERLQNGNYTWTNDQDATRTEERASVLQRNGELTVKYPDGKQYTAFNNGDERIENSKESWSMNFKQGRPSEFKYANGAERKFTFDGSGDSLKTLEVKSPEGNTTKYEKVSPGVYKYTSDGKEKKWNANVTVSQDGVYKVEDKDEKGKVTTRDIVGKTVIEDPSDKSRVEKLNDDVLKVTRDSKTVEIVRDSNKNATELRDFASNTVYQRDQNGSWESSAIDASKPFAKMDQLSRTGSPFLDESGIVSFIDDKGRQVRQSPGAKGELISDKEQAIQAVLQNDALPDTEKDRIKQNIESFVNRNDIDAKTKSIFVEHLEKIGAQRTDLSSKEKSEFYSHLNRLLESKSDKAFNVKDRALLATQLIWHVANPTSNQQGANPTCQVTSIRGKLLHEQPSQFARMMTDVITTGSFKCADKSVIKIPHTSMRTAKGSEESKFPPEDGARTWLGKLSDLTCANIHWQRQTETPVGEKVAAGQLVYRHDPPEVLKDTGARVFKDPGDGNLYPQNGKDGKLLKHPSLFTNDIANVYRQICGGSGTVIVAANREGIPGGEGVAVVSGEEQLHKQLQSDGVKIAQIWTGTDWVWKEPVRKFGIKTAEDGDGEHVVLVTGYDPKTRTVSIDNSWSTKYDRLAGDRRITLKELYKAMAKQW